MSCINENNFFVCLLRDKVRSCLQKVSTGAVVWTASCGIIDHMRVGAPQLAAMQLIGSWAHLWRAAHSPCESTRIGGRGGIGPRDECDHGKNNGDEERRTFEDHFVVQCLFCASTEGGSVNVFGRRRSDGK